MKSSPLLLVTAWSLDYHLVSGPNDVSVWFSFSLLGLCNLMEQYRKLCTLLNNLAVLSLFQDLIFLLVLLQSFSTWL